MKIHKMNFYLFMLFWHYLMWQGQILWYLALRMREESMSKIALITGASRGIGRAIAQNLLQKGSVCVLVARSESKLKEIGLQYPKSCFVYACDLLENGSLKAFTHFLQIHKLVPNVIIHSLGGHAYNDRQPLSQEALIESIQLNLGVSVALNEAYIPYMQTERDGHIIHISSDCVLDGYSPPGYVAAKAAINAYVKSSARFYARDGIVFQSVMPGIINFKGSAWEKKSHTQAYHIRKAHLARGEFGTPEEVASFVVSLCESKNMLTSGAEFLLNGGGYIRAGDSF